MAKKRGKGNNSDDTSEDEIIQSRKKTVILSDSDQESEEEKTPIRRSSRSLWLNKNTISLKKKVATGCLQSSEDEDNDIKSVTGDTPKAKRMMKLEALNKKVQDKKGLYISSGDEAGSDLSIDSEDEDELPMFENEEVPPEANQLTVKEEEGDLDGFVVEDNMIEEGSDGNEESEADEASKISKSRKREKGNKLSKPIKSRSRKRKISYCSDSSNSNEDVDGDYVNPYLKDGVDDVDFRAIMNSLSKNTETDKRNAKLYRKEMGRYQYEVHSHRNKAAQLTKKARYSRNLQTVKADRGFKEERNLDIKDSEYHDYHETCLYGEQVRMFPHTRKTSKYSSKCGLRGCGETFEIGETKIIGVTKFNEINMQFMRKTNNFGKEVYHYVCAKHLPKQDSDLEEYSSGPD